MAPVLVEGGGARVFDVDANWFVRDGMGLRAVTLGHDSARVVEAVCRAAGRQVAPALRAYAAPRRLSVLGVD